ncbi:MAG: hypothetical protein M0P59_03975 [Gallionella sp.]|nr:hypothetical protein [Gallionella sp.]MCK9353298.1 hypothetical protein [Gallionella sp.]
MIAISVFLILGVITYSWYNRDSDRVALTLITAMTLGALGFITKESISNKEEKYSKVMPVAVFYGLPDYRPLNIELPYSHELAACTQNIQPTDLPNSNKIDINFASEKYFDALQYAVIKTIFARFSQGWNVKARRIRTPNGNQVSWQFIEGGKGKEVTIQELFWHTSDNYFVNQGILNDVPGPFGGKAIFPPKTRIEVKNSSSHTFVVTLTTDYLSLEIKLTPSSSSIGLGEYSRLLKIRSQQDRTIGSRSGEYGHSVFLLEAEIKQKLLLNGHPEMKKHREWADSIVDLLDTTFNFELIREDHMRAFQLYGEAGILRIA